MPKFQLSFPCSVAHDFSWLLQVTVPKLQFSQGFQELGSECTPWVIKIHMIGVYFWWVELTALFASAKAVLSLYILYKVL